MIKPIPKSTHKKNNFLCKTVTELIIKRKKKMMMKKKTTFLKENQVSQSPFHFRIKVGLIFICFSFTTHQDVFYFSCVLSFIHIKKWKKKNYIIRHGK